MKRLFLSYLLLVIVGSLFTNCTKEMTIEKADVLSTDAISPKIQVTNITLPDKSLTPTDAIIFLARQYGVDDCINIRLRKGHKSSIEHFTDEQILRIKDYLKEIAIIKAGIKTDKDTLVAQTRSNAKEKMWSIEVHADEYKFDVTIAYAIQESFWGNTTLTRFDGITTISGTHINTRYAQSSCIHASNDTNVHFKITGEVSKYEENYEIVTTIIFEGMIDIDTNQGVVNVSTSK